MRNYSRLKETKEYDNRMQWTVFVCILDQKLCIYVFFVYLFIIAVKNIRVISGKILIRPVEYLIFVY